MSTKDKLEFVYAMTKHSGATLRDCQALLRYGTTHQRLVTDGCNGPDYSKCKNDADYKFVAANWQKYQNTLPIKKARIRAKIIKICAAFQSNPVFQNDPRGCTLKIAVPDGYTNDWGKEGICVPTS